MKITLPIIGDVRTGKDSQPEKIVEVKTVEKGINAILGGFFESGKKKLSDEKSVSTKLLAANKEWVYRNNDVIAKEISKIEFELYQIGMRGGEEEYQEIEDHPLLQALDQFNNATTKTDALYVTQSHKKLTGDAFWLIDDEGVPGTPTYRINAIYNLPPDKINLKLGNPTTKGDILVEGFDYKDSIDGVKIERTYSTEEVIHFKTPNPNNMFRGYGAVEAAASVIDLDNLTNETTRKFFENGAITNFVLSTDSKITDEQLKRLKAELRAAYTGTSKAFQTMILAGGLKPENISYTNKDLEFMAQLEWYRDKIMVIFGNTKASLGIIDDVNRASHESSIISWKRTAVKPEMEAIVNTLNEFLVPRFGDNLVLGFCDPVPEDRTSLIDEATKLLSANAITVNEARGLLHYDDIDGADELRQAPQIPEALKSVDIKKVLRKYNIPAKKKLFKELKEEALPLAKQMLKSKQKDTKATPQARIHPVFTDDTVKAYYEKQIHIVDVLEARFQNALEQYINNVVDKAINNLDNEIAKSAKKQLFDKDDLVVQAGIDFRPILTEVAVASGQQAYQLINQKDPYIATNMRSQIDRNIQKFASSLLDTDKELLIDIIANGVREGQSVPQIRGAINEKFDTYSKTQAEKITRTEVIRVSNQAQLDAFEQSGVVEGKQWLTAGDDRVDEDCAVYEGQVEYSLKGNFYTPENEFVDGDPPLHPNCRCVLLPVLEGEKAYKRVTSVERDYFKKRIADLESKVDKRTKAYKKIKAERMDDKAYIKALEKYVGDDEPNRED